MPALGCEAFGCEITPVEYLDFDTRDTLRRTCGIHRAGRHPDPLWKFYGCDEV